MANQSAADASQSPEHTPTSSHGRSWIVPVLIVGVALVLLLVVVSHWNSWRGGGLKERTNDAYVHANIVPLSTRVTDTLRRLNVDDYQRVQAGQLIAELDDTDYRAQLEQAESELAQANAALADNQVQKLVQDAKIAQSRHQLEQAVQEDRAAAGQVDSAAAQSAQAAAERHRQEALYAEQATTRQTLEKAVAADDSARASLASARANKDKASAAILSARTVVLQNEQDLHLLNAKDQDLRAQINQRLAAIKTSQVQLDYTQIHAPVDGLVTDRKVFPGQLVSPGAEIISLVEGDLWVQANFEETQLRNMRVGDRADVSIDAVPGVVFHGKILDVSPASGSQTSLLPPDNATGNFTKVIQRIPVKITLDDGDRNLGRLRPGFSSDVTVYPSGAK